MKKTSISVLLVGLMALIFLSCGRSKTTPPSAQANPAKSDTLSGATSPMADSSGVDGVTSPTAKPNHSSFNGTLMVPPQRHATVTLTMGGSINSLSLLNGQYVKQGTVMMTLKNPEFITLQQNYLDAHAQAEYLKAEYERQQRLSNEEVASVKRFQQSKADYLSMKSRLDAAAAQLLLLGVKPESLIASGIRPYLEVKAPVNGYVGLLALNVGKYVEAGQPICDVIDKGETLLCLTAYEKDLQGLEMGQSILFRVNGMGTETFHATLISIGQEIHPTSRSLLVYARVKERHNRFRPGMYVTAHVEKDVSL